jgi:hypothetical protein
MTLFEAIRALKPGQAIPAPMETSRYLMKWKHGADAPTMGRINMDDWDLLVTIIDLPAPKLTLQEAAKAIREGVRTGGECIRCAFEGDDNGCHSHTCEEGRILYALQEAAKMNIDWEAK